MVRNVEQRPVLFALVRELLRSEKLQELAQALPTRARVSEPVLPLVVAALHEELGRALTLLVAEDADARDLAEAAAWYVGSERVALLPSRGVRWDSGLPPPPHLIGERAGGRHPRSGRPGRRLGGRARRGDAAANEPRPPDRDRTR